MDPYTLNLNPDPGFWFNLDPVRIDGYVISFGREKNVKIVSVGCRDDYFFSLFNLAPFASNLSLFHLCGSSSVPVFGIRIRIHNTGLYLCLCLNFCLLNNVCNFVFFSRFSL